MSIAPTRNKNLSKFIFRHSKTATSRNPQGERVARENFGLGSLWRDNEPVARRRVVDLKTQEPRLRTTPLHMCPLSTPAPSAFPPPGVAAAPHLRDGRRAHRLLQLAEGLEAAVHAAKVPQPHAAVERA